MPSPKLDIPKTGPIAWMVLNRVTPNLLMVALLVGGLYLALNTKQEVFPEFNQDLITVSVSYPGSSPEEVERGIVLAVEEAVRGLDGIIEITSSSREGSGTVTIEYDPREDPQRLVSEVKQEIDRITTFPDDAEEPEVVLEARRRDVLEVQLYGDASEWTMRNLAEQVRDRLLAHPGISVIELEGARNYEVHVTPSREALRRHGLTLQDIADRIEASAIETPAGGVETRAGEVLVRFSERADWAHEFAAIPLITGPQGSLLTIGDICEVREAFEDSARVSAYNGKRAVGLEIFRVGDETPITVSRAVHEAMREIAADFPTGISYAIESDRSEIYVQRFQLLTKNAAIGLILVMVTLGLFLEVRLAFWVTVGIPISFIGAFWFLPAADVTFNMISMFAFIIALGIVVDDAIIVGENVADHIEGGLPPRDAAIVGTRQVAVPVTFSILTNIVAFVPLMFIPNDMGKIWGVIPLVVISVFILSWIESLFVLPAHLAYLKDRPGNLVLELVHKVQQAFARLVRRMILGIYAPFLDACLRVRYLAASLAVALLTIVVAFAVSGRMGMTLMPRVESDSARVSATLPLGAPDETLIDVRERLEGAAMEVIAANGGERLSEGISSAINDNSVRVWVYLTDPGVRPISTAEFVDQWRERAGEILSAQSIRFESDGGGPGGGAGVSIELAHQDVAVLRRAATQLAEELNSFPTTADVDDGYNPGKQQLEFVLKPEGRSMGLTSADVARQVRNALYGAEALRQQRGRNEIKVRAIFAEEERSSEFDIEQMLIRTPAGGDIPLRQIATVERGRAYNSIERREGRRTQTITADVNPEEETNQVLATVTGEILPRIMRDYPGLTYSFQGRQADMRESMAALGNGFILALCAIYFLLAIPFRSYVQPLVVMVAIPFGIVGAVLGHLMMGYSLSVISVMGIIALSGVVINNALVMIVFANEKRDEGMSAFQAMHEAGVRRFRPILLTTMTTFGGLAPMIFETSRQARFMIPMAISLGYGLVFATAITLILVPSLYLILDDVQRLFARIFGAQEREASPPPSGEAEPA